jgi:hypothetical protein
LTRKTKETIPHVFQRWKRRCRKALPGLVIAMVLTGGLSAATYTGDLVVLPIPLTVAAVLSWTAAWAAGCGWPFFASLMAIRNKKITLSDEYGEETTYGSTGAVIWGIAGVLTTALVFLLSLGLPVGLLLQLILE